MIKALLFDKDGTLFDFDATWGLWANGFIDEMSMEDAAKREALCETFDYNWEGARFNPTSPFIAGTNDDVLDKLLIIRPDLTADEIIDLVNETTADMHLAAVCDLPVLFETLKRDYTLGIATNATEQSTLKQLDRSNVREYFDFIAGSDSGHGAKPEAGMCLAFTRERNIDPAHVVMIGDSTHDLRAGRAAGMQTLGVLTGPATRDDLSELADDVIASIAVLPAWLASRS